MAQFTARDAARRLHRNERTIRRWIDQGRLQASHVAINRFAIEEKEIDRLLEETGQTTQLELESRIAQLEQQIAEISAGRAGGNPPRIAHPPKQARRRSPRLADEIVRTEADIPPGSRRAYEFAEAHGIHPKRFRYHLLTGLRGERVDHLAVEKPGRPGEVERWLSPEQQQAARDFWQRYGIVADQELCSAQHDQ